AGMFDQLGGGFARYSVDRYWLVPHFEKMLYDNAQLLRTYARSWQETGNERHRRVAEMTGAWMLREMRDPAGGFWSSLDADSEGEEGRFYVFSIDEVRDATGVDFDSAVEAFGFTTQGNFEGSNIPVHAAAIDPDSEERVRDALLRLRDSRIRPGTDTKVLAGWNGLAASALAEAGVVLGKPDWIRAASEAMDFVLGTMRVDGRLMRSYRQTDSGEKIVKHLGYAEDYAFTLEASLALFEATGAARWLQTAVWAADEAIRLFASDQGFFTTGVDAPALITRPKELVDNAVPSPNSVLANELQKVALLTGEHRYEEVARTAMQPLAGAAGRSPTGFGTLLGAIDFYLSNADEIVVLGDDRESLLATVRARYRPAKVLVAAHDAQELAGLTPLVEGRGPQGGMAAAYVCHRGVCELPVTDPAALKKQLSSLGPNGSDISAPARPQGSS
ncbi:MAG: thioredoxin domain-containing protein, partial [Actinobacteria bacterium]|nr:thioredoxin domain-containing protein [Actinomycetota bacterium]